MPLIAIALPGLKQHPRCSAAQGIHESLQAAARTLGILPLQRLSAVHLGSVAALTGALPISSAACRGTAASEGGRPPGASWGPSLGLVGGIRLQVGAEYILGILWEGHTVHAKCVGCGVVDMHVPALTGD